MKSIRILLVAVIAIACLPLAGCQSSDLDAWLKSPTTQAELGILQDWVFNQALKYLGGAFGGARYAATQPLTDEQIIQKLTADTQARYPNTPKPVIDQQVVTAFARAKAKKRGG